MRHEGKRDALTSDLNQDCDDAVLSSDGKLSRDLAQGFEEITSLHKLWEIISCRPDRLYVQHSDKGYKWQIGIQSHGACRFPPPGRTRNPSCKRRCRKEGGGWGKILEVGSNTVADECNIDPL